MNNENESVTVNLDGETLADLVNICISENKSPTDVIGEIIREEAARNGLLLNTAKSA